MGLLLASPCCCDACVAQFGRPISDISTGLWEDVTGGNADLALWDELDETVADDATSYIRWSRIAGPPTGTTFKVNLTSLVDPGHDTGSLMKLRFRARITGSSGTFQLLLDSGGINVLNEAQSIIAGSWVTSTWTLSNAQAASITNWADLDVWLDVQGTPPVGDTHDVSWVEFEVLCP